MSRPAPKEGGAFRLILNRLKVQSGQLTQALAEKSASMLSALDAIEVTPPPQEGEGTPET